MKEERRREEEKKQNKQARKERERLSAKINNAVCEIERERNDGDEEDDGPCGTHTIIRQ